jgi:hypothetical protein
MTTVEQHHIYQEIACEAMQLPDHVSEVHIGAVALAPAVGPQIPSALAAPQRELSPPVMAEVVTGPQPVQQSEVLPEVTNPHDSLLAWEDFEDFEEYAAANPASPYVIVRKQKMKDDALRKRRAEWVQATIAAARAGKPRPDDIKSDLELFAERAAEGTS